MKQLEVLNPSKYYGSGENLVKAVDGVSFFVNEGDFIAIVGTSGCGKSTLLNLLAGLDRPTSGKVYINGEDIFKLNEKKLTEFRRKNIGFVYQFYNLVPVLTIKENIILPALLENNKYDDKYYKKLIETLNLKDKEDYLPNELSGGGQQRASIGRALINRPMILFADEPTGNLDIRSKNKVMRLFKYYNDKYRQTIVMVTHDMKLARMAKRMIIIADGKIKEEKCAGK